MNDGSSESLACYSFTTADAEKRVEEAVSLEADAGKREADTRQQAQKDLELMTFRLEALRGDIQPEIWPTEEEFLINIEF